MKNLTPFKLTVDPGYYDEEGNYVQARNTLPFDTPRNQWTAKIGSIGDAIEKAISYGEYTMQEIAYLASTRISKVKSHIYFLRKKGFVVVNDDGIINFGDTHKEPK